MLINVLTVVQALEERTTARMASLLLTLTITVPVVRFIILWSRGVSGRAVGRDRALLVGVMLALAAGGWFVRATNQVPIPSPPTAVTTSPTTVLAPSTVPPSTVAPSTLPVGERLQQLLPAAGDLPAGFAPIRVPAGANHLDDDEFCGSKPSARDVIDERTDVFGAPAGLAGTRALFFSAAAFSPQSADRFLDEVEHLARSCTQWPSQLAPGQPRQTTRVLEVATPAGYGDQAVRIRLADPQGTSDFLYIRAGDLVGLVTYVVPGQADPAVVEEVGQDLARRLVQAPTP